MFLFYIILPNGYDFNTFLKCIYISLRKKLFRIRDLENVENSKGTKSERQGKLEREEQPQSQTYTVDLLVDLTSFFFTLFLSDPSAQYGFRTHDPKIRSRMLYQPARCPFFSQLKKKSNL